MSIKIRSLSIGMLVFAVFLLIMTVLGLRTVFVRYGKMSEDTDNYILLQGDVRKIENASNYLTDMARQYVITQDKKFLEKYFEEIEVRRTREKTVAEIKARINDINDASCTVLDEALLDSNNLAMFEIHSMKLIAEIKQIPQKNLPKRLNRFILPKKELELSEREKLDKAYYLVFDQNYTEEKNRIGRRLEMAIGQLAQSMQVQQKESFFDFRNSLISQGIYMGLLILLIIFIFIFIEILVIRPLRIFINCINKDESIQPVGSSEFHYLARTYNKIYNANIDSREKLRYQAEHDTLTGILNRLSFEKITRRYENSNEKLALLVIDIDKFKSVNDTYGHEGGDKALKKLASILSKYFSVSDFPVRFGGDEFAVLMTNMDKSQKQTIKDRIEKINKLLKNDDGILKCGFSFSISVGCAFTEKGYSAELFGNADVALYKTKENGRCGISFFDE